MKIIIAILLIALIASTSALISRIKEAKPRHGKGDYIYQDSLAQGLSKNKARTFS
jgi:hypothetical protein